MRSRNRIYVLYYDYKHTSGNHAGMAYLARKLRVSNRSIRLIKHPTQEYKGGWVPALVFACLLAVYLKVVLRKGDSVVFFEYLSGDFGYHDTVALLLRTLGADHHFSGIVHLGGDQLMELYGTHEGIVKRLNRIDRVLVFGSSLATFLKSAGYRAPIIQTFHYADIDYYQPGNVLSGRDRLQVLFLGSLKRNIDQLIDIMKQTGDNIDFHVCVGNTHYPRLAGIPNVTTYGYMSESELRILMQKCDVNLSVFFDTVGSNAITGTLAVGLVQVASHVGSIEDYGDASNSIWCDTTADFVAALTYLSADRNQLVAMKRRARHKAEEISLARFVADFNVLMNGSAESP